MFAVMVGRDSVWSQAGGHDSPHLYNMPGSPLSSRGVTGSYNDNAFTAVICQRCLLS